jgi:hypothetical protein
VRSLKGVEKEIKKWGGGKEEIDWIHNTRRRFLEKKLRRNTHARIMAERGLGGQTHMERHALQSKHF